MTPVSGHFTSDGLTLHYLRWENPGAPTLILLHGLRAYAAWFEEFAEQAVAHYDVVALDQRGRGASGWSTDGQYNTDAYVRDVSALIAHLGVERATLIGHSMGGTNAVDYSAAFPERVSALVIVDSAPELHSVGLTRIRSEMAETPAHFADAAQAKTFLKTMHRRAGDRSLATRRQWMLKSEADGTVSWRIDPAIFDGRLKPDPPQRAWTALSKIACPTLMVRGEESDLITAETADKMITVLAQGELVVIARAAHMVVEDNPTDFTQAVLGFLDRTLMR